MMIMQSVQHRVIITLLFLIIVCLSSKHLAVYTLAVTQDASATTSSALAPPNMIVVGGSSGMGKSIRWII